MKKHIRVFWEILRGLMAPRAKQEFTLLERRAGESYERFFGGERLTFSSPDAAEDYVRGWNSYVLANKISSVSIVFKEGNYIGPRYSEVSLAAA